MAQIAAGATTVGIASDSIGLDDTGSIARTVEAIFPIVYNESILAGRIRHHYYRVVASPPATQAHSWSDGQAWLWEALDGLQESGLADGYPDDTFRLGSDITRGEVLRMQWRIAGSPATGAPHPWSDGALWIDPSLNWAAEHDLLSGFADGTVRPGASITRAQIARLLL